MNRRAQRKAARKARQAMIRELNLTLEALRRNDAAYQWAIERDAVEELIYRRAALMCHCRAVLRELRKGETSCP